MSLPQSTLTQLVLIPYKLRMGEDELDDLDYYLHEEEPSLLHVRVIEGIICHKNIKQTVEKYLRDWETKQSTKTV